MAVINKKWTEADIIVSAIKGYSLRDAEKWINERIPKDPALKLRRTHSSIYNWITEEYNMDQRFVEALIEYYPEDDSRHQLGQAIKQKRAEAMRKAVRHIEEMP